MVNNKRVLSSRIASHLIKKYNINVFTNNMANEIMKIIIEYEDSQSD